MMFELLVSGLSLVVAGVAVGLVWRSTRMTQRKIEALKMLFGEQQRQLDTLKAEMHELRCGALGVEQRIQSAEGQLAEAKDRHNELLNTEPQSKLYNRAMKMVNLGADIEEVMQECELPRAEAELLVNLHKK